MENISHSAEEKLIVAKRAAEFGVTSTLRFFQSKFTDHPLKGSMVRTWITKYKSELSGQVKLGQDLTIKKLHEKPRGHPYLLGEEMDKQLQEYVKSLRESKLL